MNRGVSYATKLCGDSLALAINGDERSEGRGSVTSRFDVSNPNCELSRFAPFLRLDSQQLHRNCTEIRNGMALLLLVFAMSRRVRG